MTTLLNKLRSFTCTCLILSLIFSMHVNARDYGKEAEERKALEIESNSYENWPLGPAIGAQAAILMDANTGSILYAKNIHEKLYPASITKLLTAYIALQECELDEMVTFSENAVYSIDWRVDANMGVYAGSQLTMEETLYGVLVGSANEAAYAIAEHISGSLEEFAELMNQTAKELGCKNTNFVTPNGIHDENHYTSAYDMAIIAKAFFSNETLANMAGTTRYEVPVTDTQSRKDLLLTAKSQLLPGKPYAYESLVGTKTGFTDSARQTLVSCAKKNGLELICVILKEETPSQFTDTIELFDYGFDNFEAINLNEIDTKYSIENHFFTKNIDVLGNSKTILTLDKEDYIVLPNTITLDSLVSDVSYDNRNEGNVAQINYYYKDHLLGRIDVKLAVEEDPVFDFSNSQKDSLHTAAKTEEKIIYINIVQIIMGLIALSLCLFILSFFYALLKRKKIIRSRNNHLRRSLGSGNHWNIRKY